MDDLTKKEIAVGIVKGGISAIPVVGGLLNEVVFDIRSRIRQERFEEFVRELESRISRIEQDDIDENLIKSDDFADLFENVVRQATNRKMHENLQILADMTVKAMNDKAILDNPLSMTFVDVVSSLTPTELEILKKLIPYNKRNQEKKDKGENEIEFKLDYSADKVLGIEKTLFRASFDSLLSKGLVIDDTLGRWGGGQRDYIKPSQLGIELFKLIDALEFGSEVG